jgi:alkylation response protein AidB-like acyl-CoA dehydrogenase
MKYDLNEEQRILKEAAHKFLAKECSSVFIREMEKNEKGFLPEHWAQMAEFGWLGLLFPEKYGGTGGDFLDLAIILWEMGYAGWPGPFFTSSVVVGLILLEAGNEDQKNRYLADISSGKQILTLALIETNGIYEGEGIALKAERREDHYLLTGTKLFVPFAQSADTLVCAVRTKETLSDPENGITLLLVDRRAQGISVHGLDTIDDDKQYEVTFDRVPVPLENVIGSPDRGWPVLKSVLLRAAVAKCAEMSGGAQRVLDFVVPYTKERVQFGQPVGSFQAVQHHCANILTYVDTIRYITDQTTWKISQGIPYTRDASICKAWVSDSYKRLVALAHQVMGGIGFMEEHDLQLYFRRAKASELAFGDADFHRKLVAQQMGL